MIDGAYLRLRGPFIIVCLLIIPAMEGVPAQAQNSKSTTIESDGFSAAIPDFSGNWIPTYVQHRRSNGIPPAPDSANDDRYSCGDIVSANGAPLTGCEIPIEQLRPYMHPRLVAWMKFA